MKMTWLHKFFGLFFIPADGQAKSAQQLILKELPFHPLYFPCVVELPAVPANRLEPLGTLLRNHARDVNKWSRP